MGICSIFCLLLSIAWTFISHPLIIIAIGVALLVVSIVLRHPFLFILLFFIFPFFRIHEAFPLIYNFKIPLMLSLASLGALIWHVGLSGKVAIYRARTNSIRFPVER